MDIDTYFAKEVQPYAPDAWMDRSKDKVGYEINFSKYFFEHRSPRELDKILDAFDSIEKEAEKLQQVIHQAVTAGLSSNVKTKPTGIKWLGNIPETWSVYRIRHLLRPGKDGMRIGPFGSALKSDFIRERGYKVYGQENVIGKSFDLGQRFVDEEKFQELRDYLIRPGDVLITMMGSIGRCMVVPQGIETGIMDSHLIRVGVDTRKILPEYLAFLIENAPYVAANIRLESKGSIMDGLNSSIIKQLFIALPPLEEQRAVLAYIVQETSKVDGLVAQYQRELELLEEYRASLISVAVTGSIDLGNHDITTAS